MNRALIVVDVQNDFCEAGSLPVIGGIEAASRITRLLLQNSDRYALIVASQDQHAPTGDNGGHFGDPPDYVNTWPAHCVIGTAGARLHEALQLPARTVYVHKGEGKAAYSAFQGRVHGGAEDGMILDELLAYHDVHDIEVVGIALDYCVKQTALDGVRTRLRVVVNPYYTASVNPDNDPETYHALVTEGVSLVGDRRLS